MNLKYKAIFSNSSLRGLLLPVGRVVCVVAMAYYMGQVIASGVHTLGAIIISLFPVIAFGGILLLLEIQKGSFASLFSLPALSDVKGSIKHLPFFIVILIAGELIVFHSGINSSVDLVMILMIVSAACVSTILMFRGQGVDALSVFILALPFMIFERSSGNVVFSWTKNFNELGIGFFSEDIAFHFYFLLLSGSWLLRIALNKEEIKSKSWAPGVLLLLLAGLISTIFSFNPHESFPYFINYYFLPSLFFIICVNEINSWNQVKKLSLALGIMMTVVTLVWLYYALYRSGGTSLTELASTRGGGGTILGSRYSGYNGITYEYLAPMIIPIILALAFTTASRLKRNIWIGIALLMIMTIFFTFGRNGSILLFACLLPWFWRYRRGRLLFSLLLITVLFIVYYFRSEIILHTFMRFVPLLSWQTFQEETRVKIWIAAIQMLIDYPWSGVGIQMFREYAAEYGLSLIRKDEMGLRYFFVWFNAHGMIFQIISELGLPGLIAWCAMFWIPLRRVIKINITSQSLSPEKQLWITAMKSIALVISILFLLGPFGNYGLESIRVCIFILLLAIIHIMDNLSDNRSLEDHIR